MLATALKAKFLIASFEPIGPADIVVQDDSDGKGPYIVQWNENKLGPRPDKDQARSLMQEFQKGKLAESEKQASPQLPQDDLGGPVKKMSQDEAGDHDKGQGGNG